MNRMIRPEWREVKEVRDLLIVLVIVIESPRWSNPTYPAFQGIENEHDDENDTDSELEQRPTYRIITRLFSQLTTDTDN
jgi:hypothetical protein